MKTVFARALVALLPFAVVALPASASASSKLTHNHSVAKKETKKKSKHHGHKSAGKTSAGPNATTAKAR